ncbi:unnamed protein product [Sphenostylis stenocarpa]|uniref:Uncharacterized protein n=1 Tax=Sphenostylis stenocarpa TaxID=92480 RepID=A0AA86SLM1_9FABA|nr:unnamed protein product [Sphenostylis stenocarpa]
MKGIMRVGKGFDLEESGVSEKRFGVSLSCGIGSIDFVQGSEIIGRWKWDTLTFPRKAKHSLYHLCHNMHGFVEHLPGFETERGFLESESVHFLDACVCPFTISIFTVIANNAQLLCLLTKNNKEWTIPAVLSNILGGLVLKRFKNMAQQDEGWPLGLLQPVNARIELVRNSENAGTGSISFNTLLTASPSSSSHSSSDLDTQSTGSFFPDQSTTLGSLMGVSSIVELSKRSLRETKTELLKSRKKLKLKLWSWFFCLGSRSRNGEAEKNNPPSLGQFLAVERRVASENRRNQSLHFELALAETNIVERNSVFMSGTSLSPSHSIGKERKSMEIRHGNNKGFGSLSEPFSCMCGQNCL